MHAPANNMQKHLKADRWHDLKELFLTGIHSCLEAYVENINSEQGGKKNRRLNICTASQLEHIQRDEKLCRELDTAVIQHVGMKKGEVKEKVNSWKV